MALLSSVDSSADAARKRGASMDAGAEAADRREFLRAGVAAASAAVAGMTLPEALAQASGADGVRICAFEKFLQDLSYDELADVIAELGFVGIEATVRKGGHVPPERVEEDLPKLVEALRGRDLEVTVMASDVLDIDTPLNQRVLKTAASLGIRRYRMGFYTYDPNRPVVEQLAELQPVVKDLAQANQDIGVTALYQNHSGAKYVGAMLWDLHELIKDIPTSQIASAFDIRHATIEAGLAWPVAYDVMKPNIGAIYVKDFNWNGPKAAHVPLGTGRVDPKFFQHVRRNHLHQPISLHVEYLPKEGVKANIEALRTDVAVLRNWLAS